MQNNDLELALSFAILFAFMTILMIAVGWAVWHQMNKPCKEHHFFIPPNEKYTFPKSFFIEFIDAFSFRMKPEFKDKEPRCKRCWKKLTELYPELKIKNQ